jgi:hypothetical protein
MKKLYLTLGVIGFSICTPAWADTSLQEVHFNLNGTQQENDYTNVNTGAFNTTTGIGTLTWTFNPGAAGAYFFDAFFDHEVALPLFNEYGSVHGLAAAGQSWQIDEPNAGTIFPNTTGNALDNTNHIPGTTDNFGGGCHAANCNADTSMAMGFNFNLAAGEQAVVTLDISKTAPAAAFYLQQTHPVDSNNASRTDIYFDGNVAIQGANPTPEPNEMIVLAIVSLAIVAVRRKMLVGQN